MLRRAVCIVNTLGVEAVWADYISARDLKSSSVAHWTRSCVHASRSGGALSFFLLGLHNFYGGTIVWVPALGCLRFVKAVLGMGAGRGSPFSTKGVPGCQPRKIFENLLSDSCLLVQWAPKIWPVLDCKMVMWSTKNWCCIDDGLPATTGASPPGAATNLTFIERYTTHPINKFLNWPTTRTTQTSHRVTPQELRRSSGFTARVVGTWYLELTSWK